MQEYKPRGRQSSTCQEKVAYPEPSTSLPIALRRNGLSDGLLLLFPIVFVPLRLDLLLDNSVIHTQVLKTQYEA